MTGESMLLATATLVPHRDPITAAQWRSLVDAAADAGFSGIEFWIKHHDSAVADGMSSQAFIDYPRERGLSLAAAEFTDTWASPDRAVVEQANAHILDVSARAGASALQLVARQLPSFEHAVTGLGHLGDLAAERGLVVNLEFVPFGGMSTIATAVRLMTAAGRDNLGLCLDVWHWFRQPGGPDVATLRGLPGERIHMLQLDDATPEPADDLIVETMTNRVLPGEGAADITEILDALDNIGASPVVASEVYSRALAVLPPADNARRQYAAAQATLAGHRASRGSPAP